jgi:tRNA-dihydrouridine synthase
MIITVIQLFTYSSGCPQRIAHSGHFGSYLLGDEDRTLVLDIVKTVASGIKIPIFVKIRLLNTIEETLALCQQLVAAGAALIAIHGR